MGSKVRVCRTRFNVRGVSSIGVLGFQVTGFRSRAQYLGLHLYVFNVYGFKCSRFRCLGLGFFRVECVRLGLHGLPRGPIVVPFWGSYIESYKVIPKTGTTMV